MSKQDDMAGPAFPTENERQTGPNSYPYEGMTLWDYYAAKAPVLPIGYRINEQQTQTTVWAAADAADYADAMLAERRKRMEDKS